MTTETGSLLDIYAIGAAWFGFFALAAFGYFVWLSSHSAVKRPEDTPAERCTKKRQIARRSISLLAAGAHLIMFGGYLFPLYEIGTFTRSDGARINWSYFAFNAAGWLLLGFAFSLYFWLRGNLLRVGFGAMIAAGFVLFAVAPLTPTAQKRDVCFGIAVALQGIAVAYAIWFGGRGGPLMRYRGWAVAVLLLIAFVLYDTFWYIGFLNEFRGAVQLTARWQSWAGFFPADALAYTFAIAAAGWMHRPKKSCKSAGDEAPGAPEEQELYAMAPSVGLQGFAAGV
jgi:hypothetical protein